MPSSDSPSSKHSQVSTVLSAPKIVSKTSNCDCSSTALNCQLLLEQSAMTIANLEKSLFRDQLQDYKLHALLESRTAQLQHVEDLLKTEKERNERLVELTRKMNELPVESDTEQTMGLHLNDSISPLLMQQRYEELSKSNKQCRKALASKNSELTKVKCDFEEMKSRFEALSLEYSSLQKILENLCEKYMRHQERKHYEIDVFVTTLSSAIECVTYAQKIIKNYNYNSLTDDQSMELVQKFLETVRYLKKSLKYCGWIKSSTLRS